MDGTELREQERRAFDRGEWLESYEQLSAATAVGDVPLEAEMARRGFEPRREARGARLELVLERCPFVAAAAAVFEIVCAIHRGLAEGILDGMESDKRVRKLIAYDPRRAGCRLQVEPRPPAA